MISFLCKLTKTDEKAIIGLLLTLSAKNSSDKAAQIEGVARSQNTSKKVVVTFGVHTHPPAPGTLTWITIDMTDGDDTPETIHIYVTDYGGYMDTNPVAAPAIGKPLGKTISVENKLKPGLDWY